MTMKIELRGSPTAFRHLIQGLAKTDCDDRPFLHRVIAEIEDQLEPNADREMDFVDLDEVYSDSGQG